eukprot:NODE_6364_length_1678_cov_14.978079.p1 GENE.NODE_6364_length_1678_cov_14.978079~~NODE_6364_length_1678_cov_14.978079.p1  ORF type:complete len:491 (-),score=82.63 NODE_6364_length_1678_cov_14.978079:101-1573(-)
MADGSGLDAKSYDAICGKLEKLASRFALEQRRGDLLQEQNDILRLQLGLDVRNPSFKRPTQALDSAADARQGMLRSTRVQTMPAPRAKDDVGASCMDFLPCLTQLGKKGCASSESAASRAGGGGGDGSGSNAARSQATLGEVRETTAGGLTPLGGALATALSLEVQGYSALNGGRLLDSLSMAERTGYMSSLVVSEVLLLPHTRALECDEATMRRFISAIHARYQQSNNLFHNEAHAAFVLHTTHYLLYQLRSSDDLPEWERVGMDIAGLVHDVGHFSRTSSFLVNSRHPLAVTYNDKSVLENMHAATCFEIMQQPGCDLIAAMPRATRADFRAVVVELVLATDVSLHANFLTEFQGFFKNQPFLAEDSRARRLFGRCSVKCADLGHAMLPWKVHENWSIRLIGEFYAQGSEEARLGLPLSPQCQRTGDVAAFRQSQSSFLQFMILPMYKDIATVVGPEQVQDCVDGIQSNIDEWSNGESSEELIKVLIG